MRVNYFASSILIRWAPGILFLALSVPAFGTPISGTTDDCSKGGIVLEKNFFGTAKHFTVHITNKDNGGEEVLQVDAGVIPPGGVTQVNFAPPGPGIVHCDVFNTSVAVGTDGGGPGGVGPGAQQELKIEVLFVDPVTGNIFLGSVFDFVDQAYPGQLLLLPDLWANTNGDGEIGGGDLLYSLIDLNVYTSGGADLLANVNSRFVPGQQFAIVNGVVAGLPGMLFSTTAFTFDPTNGYQGTPYTGSGFAVTDHELTNIPEPGAIALFATGLLGLALARRKAKHGH